MSDSIDRVPAPTNRSTERVTAPSPAGLRLKREDEAAFSYEDQVDIHPAWRLQHGSSELDLSLAMIRALIAEELPPEAIEALMAYAPLGDLSNAEFWCDRVEQKGEETVLWFSTMTLAQALERAAS